MRTNDVYPTHTGWWWFSDDCTTEPAYVSLSGGVLVSRWSDGTLQPVTRKSLKPKWLAPVATPDAVAAAVDALKECRDELVTLRSRTLTGIIARADNAIAALTGGEGE